MEAASAPKYIYSLKLSEAGGRFCKMTLRWETVWGTTVPENWIFYPKIGLMGRAK